MDKHVARAYNALSQSHDIRKVVIYISPKLTIKLTRQRHDKRSKRHTFLLTIGNPNYAERAFIKKLIAAKEPFPVKKVQVKFYPKRKT